MANELAVAYVSLLPETSKIAPGLRTAMGGPSVTRAADDAGKKVGGRFSGAMKGVLGKAKIFAPLAAAAAGVGLVKFFGSSIKAASDAQQSVGATETVFAKASDKIMRKSKQAASAYGLSANEYRENANLIGSLFKNQGVSTDKLAQKSDKMIGVAADLAATFGGDTKTAVEALGSAFKGEFDPLEQYGISIKQSTINTAAMKVAGVKTTAAFNKLSQSAQTQAKQQATTNLIMKQSKDSLGAFAGESDTLAHQQQVLSAQFEDVKNQVGQFLLPILTKLGKWLTEKILPAVTGFIDGMKDGKGAGGEFADVLSTVWHSVKAAWQFTKRYSAVLVPLAGTVLALVAGWKAYVAITRTAAAVQAAFNLVMDANPIGLVIIAVAALAAGLVLAYKKSETFRKIVDGAMRGVKAAALAVFNWLTDDFLPFFTKTLPGAFKSVVSFIKTHWKAILVGIVAGPVGLAVVAIVKHWDTLKSKTADAIRWVVDKFLGFAEDIVKGAAKAFGWVPGIGPELKSAAAKFADFRDSVNAKLGGIKDQDVDIQTRYRITGPSANQQAAKLAGIPYRAAGGPIAGPGTGTSDSIPAMLSNGEHVLTAREVQAAGGHAAVYRLRRALLGGQHFASGGAVFNVRPRGLGAAEARFESLAEDVGSVTARLAGSLKKKLMSVLARFGGGGPHFTGSYRMLERLVDPWGAIITSAYRPGARTQFGNLSRHAMGKAIDIAPNFDIFKKLYAMRGRFYELLSPWGMWLKGQPYHNAAVQSIHRDHIHISTYDQGGVLKPGYTLAYNGTGKNEQILTNEQARGGRGPVVSIGQIVTNDDKRAAREIRSEMSKALALVNVGV